jgi:uncharacterized protein YcfL
MRILCAIVLTQSLLVACRKLQLDKMARTKDAAVQNAALAASLSSSVLTLSSARLGSVAAKCILCRRRPVHVSPLRLGEFLRFKDGSLTIYVNDISPGKDKKSN